MTKDPALYNLSFKTLFKFLATSVFSAIQTRVSRERLRDARNISTNDD